MPYTHPLLDILTHTVPTCWARLLPRSSIPFTGVGIAGWVPKVLLSEECVCTSNHTQPEGGETPPDHKLFSAQGIFWRWFSLFFCNSLTHPSDLNLKKTSELFVVCGYRSKIHFEFQWKSLENLFFRNSAGVKSSEENCREQFRGTFEGHVLYSPILQQQSGIQYSSRHQSIAIDLLKQQISLVF